MVTGKTIQHQIQFIKFADMMENALLVSGLRKTYPGGIVALENLELSVPAGSIFGYLGPNGSGKTTTVRLLNGIITPDRGTARILGHNISENPQTIHRWCGVMTESAAAYLNLSGEENMIFFGRLHGLSVKNAKDRAGELLSVLGLAENGKRKAGQYSSGMKKRLLLAIAMVHDPKLLFLDEPTSGLDPENAIHVLEFIKNLSRDKGTTVFLCTHQLRYAESVCTMYGLLDNGLMKACGTFAELMVQAGIPLKLEITGTGFPENTTAVKKNNSLTFTLTQEKPWQEQSASIIKKLIVDGADIYEARQIQPGLEDLYFKFIR